ncbi:MAG: restriction endonuclease subunit S [Bacteroidales bacterium]|nr:restriction endonuclease subunit S [Bacteroidales bacterium]
MNQWKMVSLDTMGVVSRGKSKHRPRNDARLYGGKYPFIQTGDIGSAGLYVVNYSQTYNEVGLAQSKLWDKDTLCITIAANIADTALLAFPACFPDSIMGFVPYENISNVKFVKYCFDILKQDCKQISQGTAQDNLSWKKLSTIQFPCPPLPTQHRIASILSRYDSLIENYQHQIKLLEEAAQRLYKQWFVDLKFPGYEKTVFVDGIPQGWERKAISQLGEYLNGFAFKPSDWQKSGKPIIKIKEMGNGVGEDTPRNKGERVPDKYLVKAGDLLFSWSATLMVIVWSGEDGWLNQHLFKVTPIKGIGREFLLQSISNTIEEFQNLTTGSTMKHIQRNKLDQVFVNVPNNEIMKKYNNIAEKERAEILHLSLQIRHLTEARDRLLPKLMNGEIEV